jgi:hypothetical protein
MPTGAYKTTMKYVRTPSGSTDYQYRDALPAMARRFVHHDNAAAHTPTGESVPVVLRKEIFAEMARRGMKPGDKIPGTLWDPDYVWPPPAPHEPVRTPAPHAEQDAFVATVQSVKAAVNGNIARHYRTHRDLPEDRVTQAVEWLIGLAERAEEIE